MVEVLEYLDQGGKSLFAEWFDELDAKAAAKVSAARTRLSLGNWPNVKGVGSGVYERVIEETSAGNGPYLDRAAVA